MNETPGGLSDALRDLADGRQAQRDPAPPAEHPHAPDAAEDPRTLQRDRAVDLPTPSEQVRPEPIYAKAQPRSAKTYVSTSGLASAAAPVLLTVGALLLIPAIWGTLLLAGVHVWRFEAPGARTVAGVMLICYPLAALLALGGGFYFMQHRKAQRRARR